MQTLTLSVGSEVFEELQDKTLIRNPVSITKESVTVADPRHPLFGQICELVEIYHRQDGVAFCRVKVGELGRSVVPIAVTDRGIPISSPESLLSYESLQQLLRS